MPQRKRDKEYILDAAESVPSSSFGRKKTKRSFKMPKVSRKRGWVLISEPLPNRGGKPTVKVSLYEEVVQNFAEGRKKTARVVMEGRTVKGMCFGLKKAADKLGHKNITVHQRKVDGEERIYLVKD